jgi:hypothetical protein
MSNKKKNEMTWNQIIKVAILSFLILLCTIVSFLLIMTKVTNVDLTIRFVQNYIEVFITGTCALYILLFFLMRSMVVHLLNAINNN